MSKELEHLVAHLTPENKEHLRMWVDALRSGNYKQGKKALKTDDTYCCLGVACEMFTKDTGRGEWIVSSSTSLSSSIKFTIAPAGDELNAIPSNGIWWKDGMVLPGIVAKWLFGDPKERNPLAKFTDEDDLEGLATMNDGGTKFEEIADAIERTFLQ